MLDGLSLQGEYYMGKEGDDQRSGATSSRVDVANGDLAVRPLESVRVGLQPQPTSQHPVRYGRHRPHIRGNPPP
jgi:hypothetical protein